MKSVALILIVCALALPVCAAIGSLEPPPSSAGTDGWSWLEL
jgi:hypothetical protein